MMKKTGLKARRRTCSGAIALAIAVPAVPAYALQPAAGEEPSGDGTAQEQAGAAPGDIVVTAQRRAERLRDVPLTIAAVSGEDLDRSGISNIADLPNVVPGLLVVRSGAFTQPAIRGVTSTASDPGNDSNVAIYLDGVYQPSQGANSFDLPDVERVEVLKGPQGTLFGRNATGGAIRVVTRDPDFTTEGLLSLSYGSFNEVAAKAYLSGPLAGDAVAFSLAGLYQTHDGYYHDVVTGERRGGLDSRLIRGKLLFSLSDASRIIVSGHYIRRLDNGATAGGALDGNALARVLAPTAVIADEPYEIAADFDTSVFVKTYAANIRGEFDTGIGTITALAAYNDTEVRTRIDGDYSNAFLINFLQTQTNKTFMSELTLASRKFGSLGFTAGLFYYDDKAARNPQYTQLPTTTAQLLAEQDSKAFAIFGETNLDITPELTFIAGLRYTTEKRSLSGRRMAFPIGTPPTLLDTFPAVADERFNSLTPRASLRYMVAEKTNIYATYSRGFKSGGFTTTVLSPTPYEAETNDLIEVGLKSDDVDGLHFELAGFYSHYANQQVVSIVNSVGIIQNAASSNIYGGEMSFAWQVNDSFELNGGLALLHARYKDFPDAVVAVPTGNGGNVDVQRDVSGNAMLRSPDLTASLGAAYRRELSIGELELSGSLAYSSRVYYDLSNRVSQDPYALLGLRASLQPAGTGLKISAWARNLTNKAVIQSTFIYSYADGVSYDPPRSFGVSLEYRF